jgi:beta-galactosidase/beta-glucuronidase
LIQKGGIAGIVPPGKTAHSGTTGLKTLWGKEITAGNVHQDYPRPMMIRKQWLNLNGQWTIAESSRLNQPQHILVPFPIESLLSGLNSGSNSSSFVYQREFTIPADWTKDNRVLLHFGAVDWETTVFVNGKEIGQHRGGYDPFSFDITDYIHRRGTSNLLTVKVFDPSNKGIQPRGKQSQEPAGTWYSAVSGIWQTVWLEPVPQDYIRSIQIFPDADNGVLMIYPFVSSSRKGLTLTAEVFDGEKPLTTAYGGSGGPLLLKLDKNTLKWWSPDSPNLYQLRIQLLENENPVDQVNSYCAFRTVEIRKDTANRSRIYLNGKPFFLMGITDQGYFPDGLYTAPSDAAMRMDIRIAKSLGFNTLRKLWKIEPQRWYFWCDRLGMLVWQEIPGGDNRTAESQAEFGEEMQRMILTLTNHPSVIVWSVFYEGMGQHKTSEYVDLVRRIDPYRLVNGTSGWRDTGSGDLNVHHKFPGPEMPADDAPRATVVGSFGGFTLVPPAENRWTSGTWGFQHVSDSDMLLQRYRTAHEQLRKMIKDNGLSGAVFHQLTDVESECNGLTTYDRVLLKVPPEEFYKINRETIESCR